MLDLLSAATPRPPLRSRYSSALPPPPAGVQQVVQLSLAPAFLLSGNRGDHECQS